MPDRIAVKICLYFRHVSCSSSQSLRPAHSFHQRCCWRQLGEQCALLGEQEMWWSNADKRGAFFAPQCPRAQQSCPCPAAPFCEQHWLMTILSGQIFLWKLACPLGREGGALTCQRARLHTYFCNNWALFIVFGGFFFSKTPEKASSFEIYPVHEDARVFLHSYFQHLTWTKIPKVF